MKLQDRLAKVPGSNRWYGGIDDGRNQLTSLNNGEAKCFDSRFYASMEVFFTGHSGLFVTHCKP